MTKTDDVIAAASREIGDPYVWGAEGPNAFDCSGLMQYIFAQVGISLPRVAAAQQSATQPVAGSPQPGDLVFYGTPATHVGLYLGGGRMIDAPHAGATVRVTSVYGSPQYRRVPGLGIPGVTPLLDGASNLWGGVSDQIDEILGKSKFLAIEGLALSAALLLVVLGAWAAMRGRRGNDDDR